MQGIPSSEPFHDTCVSGEPAGSDDPPCAVSPAQSFSAPSLAVQVTLLLSLITYRQFALSRCLQIWHQHISGLAGALSFTPQVSEQLTYTNTFLCMLETPHALLCPGCVSVDHRIFGNSFNVALSLLRP